MSSELDEYSKDVEDILKEIGTPTDIAFLRFKTSNTANVYGESKQKLFDDPLTLLGYLKLSPEAETLTPIGRSKGATIKFTFDYNTLSKAGLLTSPITTNDRMTFQGVTYEILNVAGAAFLAGRFLIYHVEAREV